MIGLVLVCAIAALGITAACVLVVRVVREVIAEAREDDAIATMLAGERANPWRKRVRQRLRWYRRHRVYGRPGLWR